VASINSSNLEFYFFVISDKIACVQILTLNVLFYLIKSAAGKVPRYQSCHLLGYIFL
jgi:hypothetical protein